MALVRCSVNGCNLLAFCNKTSEEKKKISALKLLCLFFMFGAVLLLSSVCMCVNVQHHIANSYSYSLCVNVTCGLPLKYIVIVIFWIMCFVSTWWVRLVKTIDKFSECSVLRILSLIHIWEGCFSLLPVHKKKKILQTTLLSAILYGFSWWNRFSRL